MNSRSIVINKLKREVIPGINVFEAFLFTFTTIVGCILLILTFTIWSSDDSITNKNIISYFISMVDIPVGVLAATFLAKRNKYAPGILAVDALLYGSSNFLAGNIALGIVNAILTPLIYLVALFFIWPKETKEGSSSVTTRKLSLQSAALLVMFILFIAIIMGFALPEMFPKYFTSQDYSNYKWLQDFNIWFDSFAAALMLAAVIMGTLRFRETFFLYLIANTIKIILFTTTLALGYKNDLFVLVIASAYYINSIFGILVWTEESESYKKENTTQE